MTAFHKEYNKEWLTVINNLKKEGYQGLEIAVQFSSDKQLEAFKTIKEKKQLSYIAQIHTCGYPISSSDINVHLDSFKKGIETALKINPDAINVHSGRDCWTQNQTLEFFNKAQEFQQQVNVPIQHETHRQRALFNPYITKLVIETCPQIYLNADISHWVLVGERFYDKEHDKEFFDAFNVIKGNARQIHARIGSPNQIQVIHPELEVESLKWYDQIWKDIAQAQQNKGTNVFYYTCEFGPQPYSIYNPKTKKQLNNTKKNNDFMLKHLLNNHK
ncbi:hypothetical protein ABPG72_021010 [Tetrahymena utriculariae]